MSEAAHLDVETLYATLEQRRRSLEISWRQLAAQAGVSPSTLTRLGQGKRPDVQGLAALVSWLGVSPESFLRGNVRPAHESQDFLTVVSAHLRARKELSHKSAEALEEIIRAAYNRLKDRDAEE
jgi:transcriptional regulator with XRE-family HTH domain